MTSKFDPPAPPAKGGAGVCLEQGDLSEEEEEDVMRKIAEGAPIGPRIFELFLTAVMSLSLGMAQAGSAERIGSSAPDIFLSFKDNTLSVKIERARLTEVLQELARQARLEVSLASSLAEEQVSLSFDGLPLEQGIARILTGKNYTLRYAPESVPPRVAEIRVISGGSGPIARIGLEVAPPSAGSELRSPEGKSLDELARDATQAPDPKARIDALKSLGRWEKEEKVRAAVASALSDQDREVRGTALAFVQGGGVSIPLEALTDMALEDASPKLRLHALDELVERSEPGKIVEQLKQAAEDPDPHVQALAQRWLRRVEGQEAVP